MSAAAAVPARVRRRERLLRRRQVSRRASTLKPTVISAGVRFFSGGGPIIPLAMLEQRVRCFNAHATSRELKVLLNHRPSLPVDEVAELLKEVPPSKRLNKEAFSLLDRDETGVADEAVLIDALSFVVEGDDVTVEELREVLKEMGCGASGLSYEVFKKL